MHLWYEICNHQQEHMRCPLVQVSFYSVDCDPDRHAFYEFRLGEVELHFVST